MQIEISEAQFQAAIDAARELARVSRRLSACTFVRGEHLVAAAQGTIDPREIIANQAEIGEVLGEYAHAVAGYLVASGTALGFTFEKIE